VLRVVHIVYLTKFADMKFVDVFRFWLVKISFWLMIGLSSCNSSKNVVYFQDSPQGKSKSEFFSPTLKKDDLLSIIVIGQDVEASKPFNFPVSEQRSMGGYTQGVAPQNGYLIDANGLIDFPVIGDIKLDGLSKQEAVDLIKQQLSPYLNEPTVIIRILNYKVTVLGEVRNPGTFTIPNDRVTVLDALGIAGDLLITGSRKDVLVIRENQGKIEEHRLDLTSSSFLSSPVFYLQQNDVVYVAPNRAKQNSALVNISNVGLIFSGLSVVLSMLVLLK